MDCACGEEATHTYSGVAVCVDCYRQHAAMDESPLTIPQDYDWDSELEDRQLP